MPSIRSTFTFAFQRARIKEFKRRVLPTSFYRMSSPGASTDSGINGKGVTVSLSTHLKNHLEVIDCFLAILRFQRMKRAVWQSNSIARS